MSDVDSAMSEDEYELDYEYEYEDEDDDGSSDCDDDGDGEDSDSRAAAADNSSDYEYEDDGEDDSSRAAAADNSSEDTSNPNAPPGSSRRRHRAFPPHSPSNYYLPATADERPIVMRHATADLAPQLASRLVEASEALGVPSSAAAPLLRRHAWSLQTLLQDYYGDPQRVLERAGVRRRCRQQLEGENQAPVADEEVNGDCPICMEPITCNGSKNNSYVMPCGHAFCLDCWNEYLTNCIQEEGATCVLAACPQAGCSEVITETEVRAVAPRLLSKFQHYQLQSFVESDPRLRWCPGKGCERIAQQVHPGGDSNAGRSFALATACNACGTSFCFGCGEEPHPPVACRQLVMWKEKNQSDSETANWMTANTKTCPKCASRIQKNGGCMHVICSKCHHGFCWMCMGSHHVYQCNAYNAADDPSSDATQRAKNELERYLHYYQRFDGHAKAQKFAQTTLDLLKDEEQRADVVLPANAPDENENDPAQETTLCRVDLRRLMDANRQIVQCRRVLKHSYVFAYYHFVDPSAKMRKECFEHHQGILERLTEGLSKVTEVPRRDMDPQDITNRTRVIGQFIKNVLENVENGME